MTRALAVGLALSLATASSAAQQQPHAPPYKAGASRIGSHMRRHMTSWHRGCPVPVRRLRVLQVSFWGFDRRAHTGRLVVHRSAVRPLIRVMRRLFVARFPIRRMVPVDAYGGSDNRSMAADNTSAFNCRRVAGTRSWSEHAYGRAIDINPVENPEIDGRKISPPKGARYANRRHHARGMIRRHGVVVRAFRAVGWGWGGRWHSPKDYQHFSATGH
jgi:poly-gamma-glutamate synthesis protein (capsule biosynthesis protein)